MATAVATFNYSVRDRGGRLISGTLDGESSATVAIRLKQMWYAPVSIEPANAGLKKEIKIPGFGGKVKLKDLSIMSRQFATMISSGLSLLRALVILSQQTENKVLAGVLNEVRNDVETGNSLSAALAKHPKIFPPLMTNMTKAGEVGGFLDAALMQIAENMEAEVHLRGKVKSAMTYPVVVFIFAILAVIGMLLFIVPTFAKMFKTLGAKLPAPTQFLVDASNILKTGFPIFLVLAVVAYIAIQKNKHKEGFRNVVDPIKLKLPVFGPLCQKVALGRDHRKRGPRASDQGCPGKRAPGRVTDGTLGKSPRFPTDDRPNDVSGGRHRCLGHHAAQGVGLLRPRGRSNDRSADGADRTSDDRLHRFAHRRNDRRALSADLRYLQTHQRLIV
jgi:type IV pilus assembly protein PilC